MENRVMEYHLEDALPPTSSIIDVYVFASNMGGFYGQGDALTARHNYKAVFGVTSGPTGQAYALLMEDENLKPLRISAIEKNVKAFIEYAKANPSIRFYIPRLGREHYHDDIIAPLFKDAPANCSFPLEWRAVLQLRGHLAGKS